MIPATRALAYPAMLLFALVSFLLALSPARIAHAQPVGVTAPVGSAQIPTSSPSPAAAAAGGGGTYGPSVTWMPTITPLPTITAFPTYQDCNVCGTGGNLTEPDQILALPTLANVTCQEAQAAGASGEVPEATCQFLQLYVFDNTLCGCQNRDVNITAPPTPSPTPNFPTCHLCGDDKTEDRVQNPMATLPFGNATVHCSFAEEAGLDGLWNQDLCRVLQNVSANVCGCGPAPAATPSEATAPSSSEYDEEAGACFLCGGPGYDFLNPDAQIQVPFELTQVVEGIVGQDDPFRCSNLQRFQDVTAWSSLVCSFLQSTGAAVCGCVEHEGTNSTVPNGTVIPTAAPRDPTAQRPVAPTNTDGTGSSSGNGNNNGDREASPTSSAMASTLHVGPWRAAVITSASILLPLVLGRL